MRGAADVRTVVSVLAVDDHAEAQCGEDALMVATRVRNHDS